MSANIEVRLQLGEALGRNFEAFWNDDLKNQRIPAGLVAQFVSTGKPKGGLSFSIPPEVIIAFSTSVAASLGAGLGRLLWDRLRKFLEGESTPSASDEAAIVIEHTRIVFSPHGMSPEPPKELLDALQEANSA